MYRVFVREGTLQAKSGVVHQARHGQTAALDLLCQRLAGLRLGEIVRDRLHPDSVCAVQFRRHPLQSITPARHQEKQRAWQEMLVPELAGRLQGEAGTDPATAEHQAAAIVANSLACLDVASKTWLERGGEASLADNWDEAVAAVRA